MFSPPVLEAYKDTPVGAAIMRGLDMLDARKRVYKDAGISYYRPRVFLITEGGPTDAWRPGADRVREGEADPRQAFSGHGQVKPEQQELTQLRREVARLKAERDILKKAAAYFARESI